MNAALQISQMSALLRGVVGSSPLGDMQTLRRSLTGFDIEAQESEPIEDGTESE
jgi:hypothetical protein